MIEICDENASNRIAIHGDEICGLVKAWSSSCHAIDCSV